MPDRERRFVVDLNDDQAAHVTSICVGIVGNIDTPVANISNTWLTPID